MVRADMLYKDIRFRCRRKLKNGGMTFGIVLRIIVITVTLCDVIGEVIITNGDKRASNNFNAEVYGATNNVTSANRNFNEKLNQYQRYRHEHNENAERIFRNKADILSRLLKVHIDNLRNQSEQVELVFLLDASASVGQQNFNSELSFMRKLLSDFTVEPSGTRVAVVTFGDRRNVIRNVDQISHTDENVHKCYLLNKQLNNITYTGGGTYTRGALLEALAILEKGRQSAKKVVFLITDGFSNGGNPRPAANILKAAGVTIFTFGIRTGNIQELHDIATTPGYTHSYLLDSFAQFEALARRALHRDLKTGEYVPVSHRGDCNFLCSEGTKKESNELNCCDDLADCACGTATGHYACVCPTGYFGSGFKGFCQPCPNGTYASGLTLGDFTLRCIPCPDVNHVTLKIPAMAAEDCMCPAGFTTDGNKCEVITCPKFRVPENGYLVKASACNNVVNAACGIRCRIGFHLTGDSIRLCEKNGSWSGNEPQCQLKTCSALRAPAHGRIHCQHDEDYEYEYKVKEDSGTYPIDTRCQFKCEIGYQLRGSKVRNCLPLSRWDGLKVTCKAITCEPLLKVSNGVISPVICLGPEKVPFSTNCTIACSKGFTLEGPRGRVCSSKTGVWSQRHVSNRCIVEYCNMWLCTSMNSDIDKIPPTVVCPSNVIAENLPGENYAYIQQTEPEVTDNTDTAPTVWTKPHIVFPWKVKIGTRTLVYIAQDSSGNKARCKFKITVHDKEPPKMENCIDPPIFFTDVSTGVNNVTWEEPIFYDNSKLPVHITQSHQFNETNFPIGTTMIVYNATDKYDNVATCVLNITVKSTIDKYTDACDNFSAPSNGNVKCHSTDDNGLECVMTCDTGYDFAENLMNVIDINGSLLINCNSSDPEWNRNYLPECTESRVPKVVSQEGNILLEGDTSGICESTVTLQNLSDTITADLKSMFLDACGNDIECNFLSYDPECKKFAEDDIYTNLIRKRRDNNNRSSDFDNQDGMSNFPKKGKQIDNIRRDSKKNSTKTKIKKDRIKIKFKFIGKIINDNVENPKEGLRKLREKIKFLSKTGKLNLLNNRTNEEIAKLALNLHLVFKNLKEICDPGHVLKKNSCVRCPLGTFHNTSSDQCTACSFGEYQNVTGSTECKQCPKHTYTKRMHAKSLQDCIPVCRPGHYSRRKHHGLPLSLEPCLTCETGSYQPNYGRYQCLRCPLNGTTENRASTSIDDCSPSDRMKSHVCQEESCLNGGKCIQEDDHFSCECRSNYVGSRCEKFQNPCDSSPCLNAGICDFHVNPNKTVTFKCTCKNGYTGPKCEFYIDECIVNPCQNGGKCISTENDYLCECNNGFEGQFCENLINHCEPSPCEEGSTCHSVNDTWECLCKPGFLGRHCNLLPCDWLPCRENLICINVVKENATRDSYKCECPDGYTGEECRIKINYCKDQPCLNGGQCINWKHNYTCSCPIPFTGHHCETEMSSDRIMHFAQSGTIDYVMIKGPVKDILEFSICLWLQSVDTFNYGTVLSYATLHQDNALTITDYNGLVLYINGQKIITDIKINDDHWHFLCITWENALGSWKVFIDGNLRDNGTHLAQGAIIPANGSLVIGQEQDQLGGGFSESESFLGKLTLLDIWDTVLDEKNISYFLTTCNKYYGSLYAWPLMLEYTRGNVMILNSPFCRGCAFPSAPFKGSVNMSEDLSTATYYCDMGYVIQFDGQTHQSLTRKCLKHGQWDGYYGPTCTKIRCSLPGYFPRGHIHGWSYTYGDEIYYTCSSGYKLRGNARRICTSNGAWSGLPPICIGITCKNLLAPENGDIEYIIEEHERDDISILQVGQQLEFKCDPGFHLVGEEFLTCLETGIWDYDRPTCVPHGCPPPRRITNGYIARTNLQNNITSNAEFKTRNSSFDEDYFYGDSIKFICNPGYKFNNSQNSSEFKIECLTNGSWTGLVPECVLIKCPWPKETKNGKHFLITDNSAIEIPTVEPKDDTWKRNYSEMVPKTDLFVPGMKVQVVCNAGFDIVGENIKTCNSNENWSTEESFCRSQNCAVEKHPVFSLMSGLQVNHENYTNEFGTLYQFSYGNVKFTLIQNTYEERLILTCQNGSKINIDRIHETEAVSNLTWKCDGGKKWKILDADMLKIDNETKLFNSTMNICQKLTCDPIKIPEHGYIVGENNIDGTDDLTVTTNVTFNCHPGYLLQGDEKSMCFPNRTWSPLPFCAPVLCGKPPTPTNAIVKDENIKQINYTFGSIITYECIPGYRIFGQSSAKCLANGKWSRAQSKCSKISCGKPKLPPGVTVHGRSYLFQDQLAYFCPGGKKQGSITCNVDGKWSDPPVCNDNH